MVEKQKQTMIEWWWQGKSQPWLTSGGKAKANDAWLMVAR